MNQVPPSRQATQVEAGIRRIIAPNASPMTYWGTNTYLVGQEQIAVIDPGPADPAHIDAIIDQAGGRTRISHVFVTHAHVDHSQGAAMLSAKTGAPVYAFGAAHRGQSDVMKRLIADGLGSGGEGVDTEFQPDIQIEDQEVIAGDGWEIEAVWTPGHIGNHLCLAFGDILFSGDHVMEWATSIVSPPDGDISAFLESCAKLLQREDRVFLPGHGNAVANPQERTQWLIDHRRQRERQVLDVLQGGSKSPAEIVQEIYTDISPALYPAAERNVFAHVIDLVERDVLSAIGPMRSTSSYKMRS